MSDTGDYLANSSTLHLILLAEHLVSHGSKDLGYSLLLAEVIMALSNRVPASALARIKDDLRDRLHGVQQQGVSQ